MAKETTTAKPTQHEPATEPAMESEYEAAEIARNAMRLFGYSPDIATAALKTANVKACTVEKARTIIKAFAERKVN